MMIAPPSIVVRGKQSTNKGAQLSQVDQKEEAEDAVATDTITDQKLAKMMVAKIMCWK